MRETFKVRYKLTFWARPVGRICQMSAEIIGAEEGIEVRSL